MGDRSLGHLIKVNWEPIQPSRCEEWLRGACGCFLAPSRRSPMCILDTIEEEVNLQVGNSRLLLTGSGSKGSQLKQKWGLGVGKLLYSMSQVKYPCSSLYRSKRNYTLRLVSSMRMLERYLFLSWSTTLGWLLVSYNCFLLKCILAKFSCLLFIYCCICYIFWLFILK